MHFSSIHDLGKLCEVSKGMYMFANTDRLWENAFVSHNFQVKNLYLLNLNDGIQDKIEDELWKTFCERFFKQLRQMRKSKSNEQYKGNS